MQNAKELFIAFGGVFAYFKLKYGAKMIEDSRKLARAAVIAAFGLAFIGGMDSRWLLSMLIVGTAAFIVIRKAFDLGTEAAVTALLATAVAWATAFG